MKKQKKIVVRGTMKSYSPLLVGSGNSDNADIEVIKDSRNHPFIPATSFIGVLRHLTSFIRTVNETQYDKFWGEEKRNQSQVSCSDLIQHDDAAKMPVIRDGIRIDNTKGIVAEKAKYDYEVVPSGAEFMFEIEIDSPSDDEFTHKMAGTIISLLKEGIFVGAKTNSGFGKIKLLSGKVCIFDFGDKNDIIAWLKRNNDLPRDDSAKFNDIFKDSNNFVISADFEIRNSLIVRSYSADPAAPDAIHIKDGGTNTLPGTSLKGALRARAEKIVNTIFAENSDAKNFIRHLFGDVEKDKEGKEKKGGDSIPSRFKVEESKFENVVDNEVQTRIKIDRFTGGTLKGALMESAPLFAEKNKDNINLKISIKNALDSERGLALLLLKDLWTGDLALGGEKSIGRGGLLGKKALIQIGSEAIEITDFMNINEEVKNKLNNYVVSFSKYADKDTISAKIKECLEKSEAAQ